MKKTKILLWTNQALPTSGTVSGPIIPLDQVYSFAIQVTYSGSPDGSFSLQGTCDPGQVLQNGTVRGVTNWTTIPGTLLQCGANPSPIMYNEVGSAFNYVQLIYTGLSISGTSPSARMSIVGLG